MIEHEQVIRLATFFSIFSIVAATELFAPRRIFEKPRRFRWPHNLGLALINTIVLRLLFPTAAVGFALMADSHDWGVFNQLNLPTVVETVIALLVLDFAIYWQHVVFHKSPSLWRLHRVHHADTQFDITTGLRFHPIEIILSMGVKFVIIIIIGASPVSVLLFEIILSGMAMFNHGNINLPVACDRWLRWFIVTPDMHRIHHSIQRDETDSNFGFNIPWWDRLFGSYREQPRAGQLGLILGQTQFQDKMSTRLDRLLLQPLIKQQ